MTTSDTVLGPESLTQRPDGLAVALSLPWYRSLWLSSVSDVRIVLDGEEVPQDTLSVELDGRTYRVDELADQWDTLWFIQDRLVVVVPGAAGGEHRVEATVELRLPYMQIAPMHYVTNRVTTALTLTA